MAEPAPRREAAVRCGFCLSLNRIDFASGWGGAKCDGCRRPILLDRPLTVSEEDFEPTVLRSGIPVLVDFHAEWCAPCKWVAPLVDELAASHAGRLLVVKVDTDRAPKASSSLGIKSVPTLLIMSGGEEVARSVGFEPEKLQTMIAEIVGVRG